MKINYQAATKIISDHSARLSGYHYYGITVTLDRLAVGAPHPLADGVWCIRLLDDDRYYFGDRAYLVAGDEIAHDDKSLVIRDAVVICEVGAE